MNGQETELRDVHCKKPFRCNECDVSFRTKWQLRDHLRNHTGDRPFNCPLCDKSYIRNGDLSKHLFIHTGEKPFSCDKCEKSFSSSSRLKFHQIVHAPPNTRPFKCEFCEKSFKNNGSLRKHYVTHTGEKPYTCDICQKKFSVNFIMKVHRFSHQNEKPFICEVCGKGFCRKAVLKVHSFTHIEEKPFPCDMCKKSYRTEYELTIHKRAHSKVKPFCCNICKTSFSAHCHLKRHLDRNRCKKVSFELSCQLCNKIFKNVSDLKNHIRETNHFQDVGTIDNKGIKPPIKRRNTFFRALHSCLVCNRKFTTLSKLARHSDRHSAARIEKMLMRNTDTTAHLVDSSEIKPEFSMQKVNQVQIEYDPVNSSAVCSRLKSMDSYDMHSNIKLETDIQETNPDKVEPHYTTHSMTKSIDSCRMDSEMHKINPVKREPNLISNTEIKPVNVPHETNPVSIAPYPINTSKINPENSTQIMKTVLPCPASNLNKKSKINTKRKMPIKIAPYPVSTSNVHSILNPGNGIQIMNTVNTHIVPYPVQSSMLQTKLTPVFNVTVPVSNPPVCVLVNSNQFCAPITGYVIKTVGT